MAYSDGSTFGYDEIFINPAVGSYADYDTSMMKSNKMPSAKYDGRVLQNIYNYENEYARPRAPLPHRMRRPEPSTYENVYDYLESSVKQCRDKASSFNPELEDLKKKLVEFQHKNDILLIFIIYLVIVVVMQYNMGMSSYAPVHAYNSPYIGNMRPSAPFQ